MSRPEVLAFLAEVRANSEDDTPRLILADWLTDHDEPERGELIRLQCRLAKMTKHDPQRRPLEEQERRLFNTHRLKWLGPLFGVVDRSEGHRGMLTVQAQTRKVLGRQGEAFQDCEEWAWVDGVHLTGIRLALPLLRSSSMLSGISFLDLAGNALNSQAYQALAGSPHLKRLSSLSLRDTSLGADGVQQLLRLPLLGQLRYLDLRNAIINDADAAALASSPLLKHLTSLDIGGNPLGPAGIQALTESPHLQGCTYLNMRSTTRGLDVEFALLASRFPEQANLAALGLDAAGTRRLVTCPHLRKLTRLGLNYCSKIGADGCQALAECPYLENLTELTLHHNEIGDNGAEALARSSYLTKLTDLALVGNDVGKKGAQALARSTSFRHLRSLHLYANRIGDEGVQALANSRILAHLTDLGVGGNAIGDVGVQALVHSPHLKELRTLQFCDNHCSEESRHLLQARFGPVVSF